MKKTLFLLASWTSLGLLPATAVGQPLPVKTVEFQSEAVNRKMKYSIVLPAKYEQTSERYPVLYLLHGMSGNYTNWPGLRVPAYARTCDLIVVMPDGGNSWYVNWAKSDDAQKNRWEDFIVKDLLGHVDANYRTIARREGRAINGLSMGGYGGLMLGLKHPDLFCSAGSHSGAIAFAKQAGERLKTGKSTQKSKKEPSTKPDPKIGVDGFSSQAERTPKGKSFLTAEDCASSDPFELVLKTPPERLPHLYLDCGTEDRLIDSNREFAQLLTKNKIPYTYAESRGGHTPAYWAREVGLSMAVQYAVMQRQLAAARRLEEPN